MKKDIKVLFTSTIYTSFIKEDFNLLENNFEVRRIIGKGIFYIFKILFNIPRYDFNYIWFASVYSAIFVYFSHLFGKKSIILIGGVDVAKDPEINYGIWLSKWRSIFVKYALKNADKVVAISPFLKYEAERLARYDGKNIVYLPTGYDYNYWKPEVKKEYFILSVGVCEDEWRMMKKGFDKLIEAAILSPDIEYKLIGIKENLLSKIRSKIPKNVEIISFVDQDTLLKYYQRAKVYCQVSYTEGLSYSLREAMLCECIPVGTDRGGIPTGIEDIGIFIPYGDINAMIEAFRKALSLPEEAGKKARERIINDFSLDKRETGLKSIIKELLS